MVRKQAENHNSHSIDDDADVQDPAIALKVGNELKTIGTFLFKKGDFANAQNKCKAIRYAFFVLEADPHDSETDIKALKYLNVHPYLVRPGVALHC